MFGWLRGRGARSARAARDDEDAAGVAAGPPLFSKLPPPYRPVAAVPVMWLPGERPPVAKAVELAAHATELGGPDAGMPAVQLVQLPRGAMVFGEGNFVTAANGVFVSEQFPPNAPADHAGVDAIAPFDLPVVEAGQEVMLGGRYGMDNWSTWLCALLPRIVLAEQRFPGRFAYLLPVEVTQSPAPAPVWARIGESLRACGIGEGRILPAAADTQYRFGALFVMTDVWFGHAMHPAAAAALAASLRPGGALEPGRAQIGGSGAG